jgi:hypothetical protein
MVIEVPWIKSAVNGEKIYDSSASQIPVETQSELQIETVCNFLKELKRSDPIFFETRFASS